MNITKQLIDMQWPQQYKEKLIVGNLESNIGIATLWSVKEMIADKLDKESFAVIGQFYDKKNAIEPFIRNCLANPNIRYIIVVGNDKGLSKEVILNFFKFGIDENHKIINTDTKISKTIPKEELEKLKNNVSIIDLTDKIQRHNNFDEIKEIINNQLLNLKSLGPYDEPKLFEIKTEKPSRLPSHISGLNVRGNKVSEVWLKVLEQIDKYAKVSKIKTNESVKIKELLNFTAVIEDEDPSDPIIPEYFRFDKEYIFNYYEEMCTPKIPSGVIYTYGSILRSWKNYRNNERFDQIQAIIDYLNKDIFRKSALATTWTVEDALTNRHTNKDKNNPCLVNVQVLYQDNKLYLTAYFRSHDMFRGWPVNAFGLRNMQKIIANGLGVEMGSLTMISASAHIYEENWQETKEILNQYHKNTNCFYDKRGC